MTGKYEETKAIVPDLSLPCFFVSISCESGRKPDRYGDGRSLRLIRRRYRNR